MAQNLELMIEAFMNRNLSETGKKAVEQYVSLAPSVQFDKEKFFGREVDHILYTGLPFALIGDNRSASRHRSELRAAFASEKGKSFPSSRWSEVHALAIFSKFGLKPGFVNESKDPTPDIELLGSQVVDVEVARADRRREHNLAFDRFSELSGVFRPDELQGDLLMVMQDASNAKDVNAMFEAAVGLKNGEVRQETNRWFAVSVPIGTLGTANETLDSYLPTWWAKGPCLFSNSTVLSSNGSNTATLRLLSQPPPSAYEGPIRRKADGRQFRIGHPLIIAVDRSALVGGHAQIEQYILENWKVWPHVCGIWMFEQRFYTLNSKKMYLMNFFRNPLADQAISGEVLDTFTNTTEISFSLFVDPE